MHTNMLKYLSDELRAVVDNIEKRIKHLLEGGQEAGVEHAKALQVGVDAIKVGAFRGRMHTPEHFAQHAAEIERITSPSAEDTSNTSELNPDAGKDTSEIKGTPIGVAGIVGEAQAMLASAGEIHTIAQELSGADKLATPALAQDTSKQAEDVVKSPEIQQPAPVTPPGTSIVSLADADAAANPDLEIPAFLKKPKD